MITVQSNVMHMLANRLSKDSSAYKNDASLHVIQTVEEVLDLGNIRPVYLDLGKQKLGNSNFDYSELIRSDTAKANGFDNRVPEDEADIIERATYLAESVCEVIRSKYGPFVPESWYRGENLEWYLTHATEGARAGGFPGFIRRSYTANTGPSVDQLVAKAKSTKFLTTIQMDFSIESRIVQALWKLYYTTKKHPKGEAVDVKHKRAGSISALHTWISKSNILFDQLIIENHNKAKPMSGWVHISAIDESRGEGRKNKKQIFSVG